MVSEKNIRLQITFPKNLANEMSEVQDKAGLSKSKIVTMALESYLSENDIIRNGNFILVRPKKK